jgi:hypothetical protein
MSICLSCIIMMHRLGLRSMIAMALSIFLIDILILPPLGALLYLCVLFLTFMCSSLPLDIILSNQVLVSIF